MCSLLLLYGSRGAKSCLVKPYNNVLISTSSFTSSSIPSDASRRPQQIQTAESNVDALLFPSFKRVKLTASSAILTSPSLLETFTQAFLLPKSLHSIYKDMPDEERLSKIRKASAAHTLPIRVDDVETMTVLICSHGQRDNRCGILGPLLQNEFQAYINARTATSGEGKLLVQTTEYQSSRNHSSPAQDGLEPTPVNVGTISHIGGHKWAGNVILYVPRNSTTNDGVEHPLAGKGIWYGRVEPRHVQGIVEETMLKGRVIKDLFRGAIGADGEIFRL